MRLEGTVVADSETVLEDGTVVTHESTIAFVGDREAAAAEYPDHEQRRFDVVAPGLLGAHVHSVQSLGRGIADDVALTMVDGRVRYDHGTVPGVDADEIRRTAQRPATDFAN